MKPYKGQIPFNPKTGALLAYVPYSSMDVEWRDNYKFDAIIKITGQGRGRSSAVFFAREFDYVPSSSYEGPRYQLFLSEMEKVIQHCVISRGLVYADSYPFSLPVTWTFCKKGSNYSLQLMTKETK